MSENSKIDWTKAVDPNLIMWVSSYCIEFDALIALPVLKSSLAALNAIERGIIREVPQDEADAINERVFREDEGEWLKEKIEARWEQIEHCANELRESGSTLRIRLPTDYVYTDGPGLPLGANLLLRSVDVPKVEHDRLWNLLVQASK